MLRSILLSLSNNKNLERLFRSNRLAKASVSRFVAGETVEEVLAPVQQLNEACFSASLDLLGESVTQASEVAETVATYII